MRFSGSYCLYVWSELLIRSVEIHALDKMPSEKPHMSHMELQRCIQRMQKYIMGGRSEGMCRTQLCGICPYLTLFGARVGISSFLASYSLLPPRVTTIFVWNNSAPFNRNVYPAAGQEDLAMVRRHPRGNTWDGQAIPWETEHCWTQPNKLQNSPV